MSPVANRIHALPIEGIAGIAQEQPTSVCCACVRQRFANLAASFNQSSVGRICNRYIYPYTAIIFNMIRMVINLSNARIFNIFLNLFRNAATATQERWVRSDLMLRIVRYTKTLAVLSIPFALFTICKEIYNCIVEPRKYEAVLRLLEAFAWLSDSMATFLNGLQMLGTLAIQATNWVFALSLLAAFLSLATIALNIKNLYHVRRLQHLMSNGENPAVILDNLLMKSDARLNKAFDVNARRLRHQLVEVHQQSGQIQQRAVEALKMRIKIKNFCHKLAIVSSVIALIGMSLFFIPLAGPGYGMLAVAAGISAVKSLYERQAVRRLNIALGGLVPGI